MWECPRYGVLDLRSVPSAARSRKPPSDTPHCGVGPDGPVMCRVTIFLKVENGKSQSQGEEGGGGVIKIEISTKM